MTEQHPYQQYLSKAMYLCSQREYCISDIKEKLKTWGADSETGKAVIRQLVNEKFIDEKRFARAFVNDKFKHNNWGKVKISVMLKAGNIPEQIITEAIGTIDDEEYRSKIKTLLESRRKTVKAKNITDMKGKLLRYGLSKGFESDLLYEILSSLEEK